MMSQGFAKLEPHELDQVQGVFVSVDPARDTLEHLETYSHYFHDNIQGVTGTAEEVAKVARMYGAAYRKVESDSAVGYMVDHSAYTYVIDREGRLHGSLPHGTMPDVIVQTVRSLLPTKPDM
jgi:protein SCO1/2